MPERIAISRLVVGHGGSRRVILPGESFKTESVGMSDEELRVYDTQMPPVMRRPSPTPRAAVVDDPVVAQPVTENRSTEDDSPVVVTARGRRRAGSDDDL